MKPSQHVKSEIYKKVVSLMEQFIEKAPNFDGDVILAAQLGTAVVDAEQVLVLDELPLEECQCGRCNK